MKVGVSILGIFVADTAYLAKRMPNIGETITGTGFAVGPGGKDPTRLSLLPAPVEQSPSSRRSAATPSATWR